MQLPKERKWSRALQEVLVHMLYRRKTLARDPYMGNTSSATPENGDKQVDSSVNEGVAGCGLLHAFQGSRHALCRDDCS
jgi:hypothetical protein